MMLGVAFGSSSLRTELATINAYLSWRNPTTEISTISLGWGCGS